MNLDINNRKDKFMLQLPFYKNEAGTSCMQASMQVALKHFLDKEYSIKELDKLTGRKEGLWTYTSQAASVLNDLSLNIRFYSKTDIKLFLGGEKFIRENYGKDAEQILKYTDLPVVIEATKKLLNNNIFKQKLLSVEELEESVKRGYVVIVLIDLNKILGVEGHYRGHYVNITGFDVDSIYIHDSGPLNAEANKKVDKQIFIDAMNANGTDNDVIVVRGLIKD